ncbi:MAG: helix-turn-helix transcriptional regulator [Candidatus Sericytochromatia bacterium]|nr:helix-turn-helix transcriptional regulator [Candidatus Sericytochromatia bacterium]
MDTFGSTVRRAREQRGWSLEDAARHIGLSKSRLRELETGLSLKTRKPTRPTADNVARVARGLGLDQDHLAGLAGLGYRVVPGSSEETAILAAFRALPQPMRPVAVRVVEALGDAPARDTLGIAAEGEAPFIRKRS